MNGIFTLNSLNAQLAEILSTKTLSKV